MKATKRLFAALAITSGAGLGCFHAATGPSTELLLARQAVVRAEAGPVPLVAPERFLAAREALAAAERAYEEAPSSARAADLAYIAGRSAEIAEAEAGLILARRRREDALRLGGGGMGRAIAGEAR